MLSRGEVVPSPVKGVVIVCNSLKHFPPNAFHIKKTPNGVASARLDDFDLTEPLFHRQLAFLSPNCRQSGYTSCRAGLIYLRGRLCQDSGQCYVCMLLVDLPRITELQWICLPCLQRLLYYIHSISPFHSSPLHRYTKRARSSLKAEQVSFF